MVEINIKKPEFIKLPRVQKVLTACLQCGYCIDVCEAHNQTPWESVTPRGKIYYVNQLDKVGTGALDGLLGREVSLSPEFVDAMYKCTGCGNCEVVCHAQIHLVDFWEDMRAWIVENGAGPLSAHKGMAAKVAECHNPYGEPPSKRDAWWPAEVERAMPADVIFFAGCTGSYRMQNIAQAGVIVLSRAGVKMNCLGEKEWCCSSPLLRTGTKTESLGCAETVVEKADGIGGKDMVMTCSGCYKTVSTDFGKYYAKVGQNVYHFSTPESSTLPGTSSRRSRVSSSSRWRGPGRTPGAAEPAEDTRASSTTSPQPSRPRGSGTPRQPVPRSSSPAAPSAC